MIGGQSNGILKGLLNSDGSLKDNAAIGLIIIISILVFGSFYYYIYVYDSLKRFRVNLLSKPRIMNYKNKKNDLVISPTGMGINPSETEVSYSMWMYLDNFGFKYGKKKHIFSHGYNPRFYDKWRDHRIMIKLGEINNTLEVNLTTHREDKDYCLTDSDNVCMNINGKNHRLYGGPNEKQNFVLHNIPIKRWVHLLITVVGDTASIYINGSLVKDIVMKGELVPLTKGYIFIGSSFSDTNDSGFGGKLAKVEIFRRHLEANDVYSIYREGNIPRDSKKKKFLKAKDVSCIKKNQRKCDSRYEFDSIRSGCCPNLRCVSGTCVPN